MPIVHTRQYSRVPQNTCLLLSRLVLPDRGSADLVIHIGNPFAFFVFFALFVWGLVVYPFVKSDRFRITPSKTVAIAAATGIAIYNGSFAILLVFLWPLSFIWFPEYWGDYTGFIRGPYIDEKSPPILISLMGWFFLVVLPLLFLWIASRQANNAVRNCDAPCSIHTDNVQVNRDGYCLPVSAQSDTVIFVSNFAACSLVLWGNAANHRMHGDLGTVDSEFNLYFSVPVIRGVRHSQPIVTCVGTGCLCSRFRPLQTRWLRQETTNMDREQGMGMMKEFKEFAMRGNVVDLAVGIIIGGAFGKIVSSLVGDILMPPIGMMMGNVNFSDLFISLDPEKTAGISSVAKARETGAAVIAYGSCINTVIDFIIVAFCIFLLVKAMNRMKKTPEARPATTKDCPLCLSTIPIKASRCAYCTSEVK